MVIPPELGPIHARNLAWLPLPSTQEGVPDLGVWTAIFTHFIMPYLILYLYFIYFYLTLSTHYVLKAGRCGTSWGEATT